MCTFITIAINIVNVGVYTHTSGDRWEAEFKDGTWHGKATNHWTDGTMENHLHDNGKKKSHKEITDKKEAFYHSEAPHMALFPLDL